MSEFNKGLRDAEGAGSGRLKQHGGGEAPPRRIVVDKRTHRLRLENETEGEVTDIIEEKGGNG